MSEPMKRTITINADKRYYIDEASMTGAESFLDTLDKFNQQKIDLYQKLYNKQYKDDEFLVKETTVAMYLKDTYGTNAYYTSSIYAFAQGVLSSQRELNKLYKKTVSEDIKTRKAKIADSQKQLDKARSMKQSLRIYIMEGKWKKPYPRCTIKIKGKSVCGYRKNLMPIEEYERIIEDRIRKLKNKVSMLNEGLRRREQRLENLTELPPRPVIFGTRKGYAQKDNPDTNIDDWKQDFHGVRYRSMSLPGRHDAHYCNFIARYFDGDLHVTCMDGKEAVFKDFVPARYETEFLEFFNASPKERKALCYNFVLKKDRSGRTYLQPSVTMVLEEERYNDSIDDGAVSIDLNWNHIALANLDAAGNLIEEFVIPVKTENQSAGQILNNIGRAMDKIGQYCESVKKPLIMEDIDLVIKRSGLKYKSPRGNRHVSLFAYRKMTSCAINQGFRRKFAVFLIDPAYTSQMGKFLYMRSMGKSVHEAAAYCIGLKGMRIFDRLKPPDWAAPFLTAPSEDKPDNGLWARWKQLTNAFRSVPTHALYYNIPDMDTICSLTGRKKPSLKMVSEYLTSEYKIQIII